MSARRNDTFDKAKTENRPETCSVEVAATRLGIGRTLAYQLAREGRFPVPVIRMGRKMVVPTRLLDRLLSAE